MTNNFSTYRAGQTENKEIACTEHLAELINHIFDILRGKCNAWGYTFKTQDDIDMAKRVWMLTLCEEKITDKEQLNAGIKKLLKEPMTYIPDVCQFIKLCKPAPKDLGLPSTEEAYRHAIALNTQFSNYQPDLDPKAIEVIKQALTLSDRLFMRSASHEQALKRFTYNYEVLVQQIISGEYKPILQAIEKQDTQEQKKKMDAVLPKYSSLTGAENALTALKSILR